MEEVFRIATTVHCTRLLCGRADFRLRQARRAARHLRRQAPGSRLAAGPSPLCLSVLCAERFGPLRSREARSRGADLLLGPRPFPGGGAAYVKCGLGRFFKSHLTQDHRISKSNYLHQLHHKPHPAIHRIIDNILPTDVNPSHNTVLRLTPVCHVQGLNRSRHNLNFIYRVTGIPILHKDFHQGSSMKRLTIWNTTWRRRRERETKLYHVLYFELRLSLLRHIQLHMGKKEREKQNYIIYYISNYGYPSFTTFSSIW